PVADRPGPHSGPRPSLTTAPADEQTRGATSRTPGPLPRGGAPGNGPLGATGTPFARLGKAPRTHLCAASCTRKTATTSYCQMRVGLRCWVRSAHDMQRLTRVGPAHPHDSGANNEPSRVPLIRSLAHDSGRGAWTDRNPMRPGEPGFVRFFSAGRP